MPPGDSRFHISPLIGFDDPLDLELACALILERADQVDEMKRASEGSPLARGAALLRSIVEAMQDADVDVTTTATAASAAPEGLILHADMVAGEHWRVRSTSNVDNPYRYVLESNTPRRHETGLPFVFCSYVDNVDRSLWDIVEAYKLSKGPHIP